MMSISSKPRVFTTLRLSMLFGGLLSALVHAEYKSGPVVDVRTLDIAGVKLGMNYREVVDALATTYEVEPDAIKIARMKMDIQPEFPELPASLRLNSEAAYGVKMGLPNTGWEISVRFTQILPSNDDDSVQVSAIEYEMAWTQENRESLREAALTKYGEPTVDKQSMGLAWCIKPSTHWATCESEAVLEFSGTSLKLQDTRPSRLHREAQDKKNSAKTKI